VNDRSQPVTVHRIGDNSTNTNDRVVTEEPLEIRVGAVSVLMTMRTPGHDHELAAGLLFTEGVVSHRRDIRSVEHCQSVDHESRDNVVVVNIADGVDIDLEPMRRGFYSSSSCGVCGKTSLEQVRQQVDPLDFSFQLDESVLRTLPQKMRDQQSVFDQTGGSHAAALFDQTGRLLCLREDIGRHNAVDKVIGWSLQDSDAPLDHATLLVSGRSSFEIVQKALRARVQLVASVSAASSLAVKLAVSGNQTLVGFLRPGKMTVYSHQQRIVNAKHSR
jgi:FdhD protein